MKRAFFATALATCIVVLGACGGDDPAPGKTPGGTNLPAAVPITLKVDGMT